MLVSLGLLLFINNILREKALSSTYATILHKKTMGRNTDNERQSSKKTVSFRVSQGGKINKTSSEQQHQNSYSSKRPIEYNDIIDRYDITGNNNNASAMDKRGTQTQQQNNKNKNVVDNMSRVKNDNNNYGRSYGQEGQNDDDSEYSNYYNSKASSSPKYANTLNTTKPPPPPPQVLEETTDSFDDNEAHDYSGQQYLKGKQTQQQAPLPPQTLTQTKRVGNNNNGNPYNGKSTASIEAEISQTQRLMKTGPTTATKPSSIYQHHPMDESNVSYFLSSEASSPVSSSLNNNNNHYYEDDEEIPLPKTKSFVTRLTDDAISKQKESMTQSDYEIQTQLSILGKLGHNMRFKQHSDDDDDHDDGNYYVDKNEQQ